jgi:hypothetical protein
MRGLSRELEEQIVTIGMPKVKLNGDGAQLSDNHPRRVKRFV